MSPAPKLFAAYVGGMITGGNIELHDMRFVIGQRIQDTYGALRSQWWGIPESLHLDCWAELDHADGYFITLKREPSEGALKLYYVNVGGYGEGQFTELHENIFVVAPSEHKAKVRALKKVKHWGAFHQDEIYEAEQCFDLNDIAGQQQWFVHLTEGAPEGLPPVTCQYLRIGKR